MDVPTKTRSGMKHDNFVDADNLQRKIYLPRNAHETTCARSFIIEYVRYGILQAQ